MKRSKTRFRKNSALRISNPFGDLLVSELLEDPTRYRKVFSQEILVSETLDAFTPKNVVLLGPQGSGKSMILNLMRASVLSEWISEENAPPSPLNEVRPFLGITGNLVQAHFHIFGRRSVARTLKTQDHDLDLLAASDYLNHYLFAEFIQALKLLTTQAGRRLRVWLGITEESLVGTDIVRELANASCWAGHYSECRTLDELHGRAQERLTTWLNFLNANLDEVPVSIWRTKATLEEPLREMGRVLNSVTGNSRGVSFFVVIDQYEVLPELNRTHGTELQRVVNTLIKARDPLVFYKIGARTHDWGTELRIWGAESRIEVQRDYSVINLTNVLMRNEDKGIGWLFPEFAKDVLFKRIKGEGQYDFSKDKIPNIFGVYDPEVEARDYIRTAPKLKRALGRIPGDLADPLLDACDTHSPIEVRLAGAWAMQLLKRGISIAEISSQISGRPWRAEYWWKERVETALLQLSSLANQRRRYFGWQTVYELAGSNISLLLLICGEIWDAAAKSGGDPLRDFPLSHQIQTDGILDASRKWRERDRNERGGGSQRYDVLSRLGPAINSRVVGDFGISNPGYFGFSLRETDLGADEKSEKVRTFLNNGVSWAIFEERAHTSKNKADASRRKWYLHALLSPVFAIPFKRVKEPLYLEVGEVYRWFLERGAISFGRESRAASARHRRDDGQMGLPLQEDR